MEMGTDDYRRELEALNRQFAGLLPGRMEEIEQGWRSLAAGAWDGDRLREVARRVHVLSGSASTFGYPDLGRAAIAFEKRLKRWAELDQPQTCDLLAEGSSLVANLRRDAECRSETARIESMGARETDQRLVYLLEDDRTLAEELRLHMSSFGYRVEVFYDSKSLVGAFAARRPDALVADIMLREGDLAGVELLASLRQGMDLRELPVLFVTARNDVDARLAAVRGGAAGYYVKPLDVMALVERLNRLTQRPGTEPFRILITDDDQTLAEHYALVLRHGGMQASVLTRPLEILDRLSEELPDLVLMDINMPECTGLELVQIIRQFDRFLGLPIVYLSTETDLELQLSALRIGGDDFLTKPITDQHLLAAVAIRAERSRVLRSLMTRDSLTSLLTHVALKEQLATELARSQRLGTTLSFAMLDIDGFKQVNDRHGHLLGDRVLKSLADLLRQRVRTSDTVGRYGGEEFGIVLPDCALRDAVPLVDDLRQSFAGIRFRSAAGELYVGFSAGVAASDPECSPDDLIDRADRALYQAKARGGNRIMAAEGSRG